MPTRAGGTGGIGDPSVKPPSPLSKQPTSAAATTQTQEFSQLTDPLQTEHQRLVTPLRALGFAVFAGGTATLVLLGVSTGLSLAFASGVAGFGGVAMLLLIAMGAAKNPEPGIPVSKTVRLIADFGLGFYAIPALMIAAYTAKRAESPPVEEEQPPQKIRKGSVEHGIELTSFPKTDPEVALELAEEWTKLTPVARQLQVNEAGQEGITCLIDDLRLYNRETNTDNASSLCLSNIRFLQNMSVLTSGRAGNLKNLNDLVVKTLEFFTKIRPQEDFF